MCAMCLSVFGCFYNVFMLCVSFVGFDFLCYVAVGVWLFVCLFVVVVVVCDAFVGVG